MWFFGCINRPGHYLFNKEFQHIGNSCEYGELDGKFPPKEEGQPQGKVALANWKGHTVLAFWDRTVDTRFGSNAAFIEKGDRSEEEMRRLASENFPSLVNRMI